MHTAGSLAAHLKAELIGPSDLAIAHPDTLERAGALTFIRSAGHDAGHTVHTFRRGGSVKGAATLRA
jgi:hypothetical protein